MRRKAVSLILMFSVLAFSVKLVSVNVTETISSVVVELTFDRYPVFTKETDTSRTVHSLVFQEMEIPFMMMPVHIGPLEVVRFAKVGKESYVVFYTLVPSRPTITRSGSTINVSFKKSPKRVNISFEAGVKLEEVVKYISEYLNLNVIISAEVSKLGIPSIMMNNVTPEDAIRNVLISVPGVAYSYFPDGTLYIGKAGGDIAEKFNKFWGVYNVDSPETAEAVSEIVPGAIVEYLKRKSILLVYGGPAIHTKIAEILSGKLGYEVVSVKDPEEAARVLQELFEASVTFMPPDKVVLKGDLSTITKMKDVLSRLGIVGKAKEKLTFKSSDVEIEEGRAKEFELALKEIEDFVVRTTGVATLTVELYPSLKKVAVYGSDEEAVTKALGLAVKLASEFAPKKVVKEAAVERGEKLISEAVDVKEVDEALLKELKNYVEVEKGAKVKIYSYPKLGKVLIQSSSKEVIDFVKGFLQFVSRKDVETDYLRVSSQFQFEAFEKTVKEVLPDLKVVPLKESMMLVVSGKKEYVQKVKDMLRLFQRERVIVRVFDYPAGIPVQQLFGMLEDRFPSLKYVVVENRKIVVVSGSKEDVGEFERVMSDLEMQLEKIPVPVTQTEATETQVVTEMGGKLYIDAPGVPLAKVIKEVFRLYGKSIVFIDHPAETVYMSVSGLDFDAFERIIDLYGYRIERFYRGYLLRKKEVGKKEEKPIKAGKYVVYKVSHNLEKVKEMVEHFGGKIFVDGVTGLSIISGIQDDEALRLITTYIKDLSQSPKQIEIEVKLVDEVISEDDSLSLRTSLGMPVGGGSFSIDDTGLNLTTDVIDAAQYEKILEGLTKGNVSLTYSGANNNIKANILAAPKVVASSGEEARVFIGDKEIYVLPSGTPLEQLYGVELVIKPTYRPDGTIDLEIKVKVSNSAPPAGDTTIPAERMREATTKVVIKEGEKVVIGGLSREIVDRNVTKLPLLGDLPIIGQLFRSVNESKEMRNMTIFISAKVVKP